MGTNQKPKRRKDFCVQVAFWTRLDSMDAMAAGAGLRPRVQFVSRFASVHKSLYDVRIYGLYPRVQVETRNRKCWTLNASLAIGT